VSFLTISDTLSYILFEKSIYILTFEMASLGRTGTVPIVSAQFRSLLSSVSQDGAEHPQETTQLDFF